jgi:hypothetical protein
LIVSDAFDRCHSPISQRPGDPAPGEHVQLLVGDRVERPDVAAVAARELVEPDVRALRDEDDPGHPVAVVAEPLGLGLGAGERRRLDRGRRHRRHRT